MDLGADFALMSRLIPVLEHNRSMAAHRWSAESFLLKIGELAERTRTRSSGSTTVDRADVIATVGEANTEAFLQLASDSGLLALSGAPPGITFPDLFSRDGHAARYLLKYLAGEYVDRGFVRDRAVAALIQIGIPAVRHLVRGLGHADNAVRLACSVALRTMGPVAAPALVEALGYGNDQVRRYAVEACATPESSRLVTAQLIDTLLNDPAPLVRAAAALALKEGGTPEGVDALVSALKDPEALVVTMVKSALGHLDTPSARRALYEFASSPKRVATHVESRWPSERISAVPQAPRVFLSYPREHQTDVGKIRALLREAGYDVWLDSEGLHAGQQWQPRLSEAICSSDFVVALLSKHSWDGYQVEELNIAARYVPTGRPEQSPFLVPVTVDTETRLGLPSSVPEFLRGYHLLDLERLEESWPRLLEAITAAARSAGFVIPIHLRTEPRTDLTPASVNRMLISRNFYDSQINDQGRPPYLDFGGLRAILGGELVHDLATGRIWTRQAFELPVSEPRNHVEAFFATRAVATEKNRGAFGGFSDWRIPTIEEVMSLMTPYVRQGGLHLSELFSDHAYVGTCDSFIASAPQVRAMSWFALYGTGECQAAPAEAPVDVRLVRSAW